MRHRGRRVGSRAGALPRSRRPSIAERRELVLELADPLVLFRDVVLEIASAVGEHADLRLEGGHLPARSASSARRRRRSLPRFFSAANAEPFALTCRRVLREQRLLGVLEVHRFEQHRQLVRVIVVEVVRGSFRHSVRYERFFGYYVRPFPSCRDQRLASLGRDRAAARPRAQRGDAFRHDDGQRPGLA